MNSKKSLHAKKAAWRRPWIWLLLALAVALAGGAGGWVYWKSANTAQASASTQTSSARTTTVTRGSLSITASGSGTLVASQSVDLSFSTRGTVAELNVTTGDTVQQGQVLAKLGSSESLEAAVASAELEVLQAKNSLDALQKNASVSLATAYQSYISAQAAYSEARTAEARTAYARCSQDVLNRYQETLDNVTALFNRLTQFNNGSDEWLNAKNDLATATANYTYCKSYTADEIASAKAGLQLADSNLKQAESSYKTLKDAAGVDPDQLALAEATLKDAQNKLSAAQTDLEGITLSAPIDGMVIYLAANKGAIVDTSRYITIAAVSTPTVTVSVDESDMDKLVMGAAATVTFDALPDDTFRGKVVQVSPQLSTSGSYRVATGKIELEASAAAKIAKLPLGLTATITITSQEAKDVLLIPVSALKSLGDGQYGVMVKGSDGQLKLQSVSIGLKDDTNVVVTSGLNEGDEVSTGTVQASSSASSSTSSNQNSNMMPLDGGAGGPPPGQ